METVTDEVCRRIRARILNGAYEGGSFLTETEVADDLGISSEPVKAAFEQLAATGWLESIPYRGARVVVWNRAEADEIGELRALLESQAARRAAQFAKPHQLRRLEEVVAESERLLEAPADAVEPISELNLEFHQLVIAAAGSGRLQRLLDAVMHGAISSLSTYHLAAGQLDTTTRHHRRVLEAIAQGDADAAAARMREHIETVYLAQP